LPHIDWSYCTFDHYNGTYLYFYNYIFPPVFNKIPLNGFLYLLIALTLPVALFLKFGLQKRLNLSWWMVRGTSVGVILILAFQICWQQRYWAGQMRTFASSNEDARIRAQWPDESRFLDFVLSHAPLCSACYIVSKTNPRRIRYELYPKVLVTNSDNNFSNCVVVFKMLAPLQYVPAGVGSVLWYDSQSLMAFKGD